MEYKRRVNAVRILSMHVIDRCDIECARESGLRDSVYPSGLLSNNKIGSGHLVDNLVNAVVT